ncbi:unnamed protein product [Closterium sp. NIES-53]
MFDISVSLCPLLLRPLFLTVRTRNQTPFSESASVCPPFVGGECALGTDVLEDRQEEFECFAAAVPHLVSMLLAPEGDPDAPDIPTPRSYAEAITGPYSSQWQAAMDAEMASWKSTGTYVDKVPSPGANIVSGMWIFRGVFFFETFSPTPKMTTLWVLVHVAAQRDYELHSLYFSTAFLQGSLHEEIWLRHPPGFTGTTLAALGFAPSTAEPSLFLRTDATLPPFYVLVYVDDLVFAIADTETLAHVKLELQKRHTCTDLGEQTSYLGLRITRDRAQRTITLTQSHMVLQILQHFGFTYSSPQSTPLPTGHSLSAPPSDESVEPSGPYPELVGCLVTSGMGLVLGGRARVVLTGHSDASWVDDLATQRSSQGYTFSFGSGSVSWRSTRSSSVLSSSCEAEIYAGAMAAQDLRWATYLLTDLGEAPRSPPNLYQRGQLRLAYVASWANIADVFTKVLHIGLFKAGPTVKMADNSIHKMAFRTRYGSYDCLVMPFGPFNALATFQAEMNHILQPLLDECVVVYLGDILVYFKNMKEHVQHLWKVFQILRKNKFYVKLSKSDFALKKVQFLGHMVSAEGVHMDPRKIKAVKKWKVPENMKELLHFLGFANYYNRFVPQYAKIAAPLTDLLKKFTPYKWDTPHHQAMEQLQTALTTTPILILPDPDKDYVVEEDTSDQAVGAVLMQDH